MVRIFHMFALLQNTISPFLFTDLPQVMVAMMLLLHFLASSLLREAENSSSYSRDLLQVTILLFNANES